MAHEWKGIENPEIDPPKYSPLIFGKRAKQYNRTKMVFLTIKVKRSLVAKG